MAVSVYAATLVVIYVVLSFKTLLLRRKLKIFIDDGGDRKMARAMRVHANFAEYVPIALILILCLELNQSHWAIIHFVGMTLLIGRCLHAYGVAQQQENYNYRVAGMVLTFTSICASALALIVQALIIT